MATKKTAKKATKAVKKAPAKKTKTATKKATKRSYKPRAKTSVEVDLTDAVNVATPPAGEPTNDQQADIDSLLAAADASAQNFIPVDAYKVYDLRALNTLGKALFLLELQSLGYLMRNTLETPLQNDYLLSEGVLKSLECLKLNHDNKLVEVVKFGDLSFDDGMIASPDSVTGGLTIHVVSTNVAAPTELTVRGERFVRARR